MKKMLKFLMIFSIVLMCKSSNVFGICNTENQFTNNFSTFKYKVDLNGNGGTFSKTETSVSNGKINLPTPTRAGYSFNGYSTSKDGTVDFNVSNVNIYSISSKTLYAKWNITTYKISYDLGNGILSDVVSEYNVEKEFTLGTPTKNGYTFTGWTGTGLSSATKTVTISKGSTGNKSYTANWTPTNYTITYNLNSGTISGQKTSYNIESNAFSLPTPTRTGYTFTGWSGTGITGTSKTVTVNKGSTGNRSYTANWVDDIKPDIYNAWITSGPYYEFIDGRYGYTVNVQISCGDSGSGINRVLTYYENSNGWVGETNITGTMTDSFWFIPGYRKIKFVVYDNAGNSSETIIAVQCG